MKVPYELFEKEGFNGLVSWYETLGIENEEGKLDPRMIIVNNKTFGKIIDAMLVFYGQDCMVDVGLTLVNIGPSGYNEVPEDEYKVMKAG